MIAQEQVLNGFARRYGLMELPMLAYDLVVPDYERYKYLQVKTQELGVPAMVLQLKRNRDLFQETVTEAQLFEAIRVFELGRYSYEQPNALLERARLFLRMSEAERLSALKLSSVTDCDLLPGDYTD